MSKEKEMEMKPSPRFPIYAFASPNVVSIAAVIDDKLQNEISKSDYVRNETLRRCLRIPSYRYKSLQWKNKYYDLFRKRVLAEVEA